MTTTEKIDLSHLTREQAVKIVGETAVNKVEAEKCEPTNVVGYNGACQGDDTTEWSAIISCVILDGVTINDNDMSGDDCALTAYYYTTNAEDERMAAAGGDGAAIDWEISHYAIN